MHIRHDLYSPTAKTASCNSSRDINALIKKIEATSIERCSRKGCLQSATTFPSLNVQLLIVFTPRRDTPLRYLRLTASRQVHVKRILCAAQTSNVVRPGVVVYIRKQVKRKQKTAVPDCVNSFFLIGEIKLSGNYRGDSLLQPQAPRRTAAGNSEVVYLYIWGHEDSGNLFGCFRAHTLTVRAKLNTKRFRDPVRSLLFTRQGCPSSCSINFTPLPEAASTRGLRCALGEAGEKWALRVFAPQ